MLPRALAYIDELERRGRYTLMVWPVHCEIGSWGHNVHPAVKAAYNLWEDSRLAMVQKIGPKAATPGRNTTAPCRPRCRMKKTRRRSSTRR
jgi:nicotinamidase-related amidase